MNAALADTLAVVAEAAALAADDWWIIGSVAVLLQGGDIADIRDVDVMMSGGDAEALLRSVGVEPRKGTGSERFRSEVFGTWTNAPIPIEVFGGFSVAVDGEWRDVSLRRREVVTVEGARLFVPSARELVQLLQSFGRPKDLERAGVLSR